MRAITCKTEIGKRLNSPRAPISALDRSHRNPHSYANQRAINSARLLTLNLR